jgi:hypothetical protein
MQASSYPSVFHRLNLEGNLLLPNAGTPHLPSDT